MAESEKDIKTTDIGNIGYEIGKWYMVAIEFRLFVPAKFVGLRVPCSLAKNASSSHDFPHPGEAVFENVKPWGGCGFEGARWVEASSVRSHGRYTNFRPAFREVGESELWAVQAIEKFQYAITGRQKSFEITLPNGFRFTGKIIPPKEKDNLPGEYYAKTINPATHEKKEGTLNYDGKSESVRQFILSKLPGWHIISIIQRKILPGLLKKE